MKSPNVTKSESNNKSLSTRVMASGYILIAGMLVGSYLMHSYDQNNNSKTAAAVASALKTIPVAQAASK